MHSSRTILSAFTAAVAIGALLPPAVTASPETSEDREVGAAITMSRFPSSPSGVIKGPAGDLVFGGAKGRTISGFWSDHDRRRAHGFMIYLPAVECTGGLQAVDLRRVLEVPPENSRTRPKGDSLTGQAITARGAFHASGTNFVGYSTPDGDVSGPIEESVSGTVAGDRVSGTYLATLWLSDSEGTPFALCSAAVGWSGRQGARRHFVGGSWTSPLYLERSADGRRVKRIRIATNLSCDDGSIWQGYTGFRDLAVRHDRFSLASDSTDPWDVGELHDVTTGGGTFKGTRVQGTFGDDLTVLNPARETTAHCQQGSASWTAYSSGN